MIQDIHNIPVISDSDDSVRFCKQLCGLFPVPLCETSGEDDFFQGAVLFQGTQLQNGFNGFFLCGLNKSAGIDNRNFCLARFGYQLIAMRTQLCQHALRIYQIFGTSQGDHADTNRHRFFLRLVLIVQQLLLRW